MNYLKIKNIVNHMFNYRFLLISLCSITLTTGCATRNVNIEPGSSAPIHKLSGKRVAIIPVIGNDSIGTESQMQLKKSINKYIDGKLLHNIPNAKIITTNKTIQILNKNNKLDAINNLAKSFRNIGVFDYNTVNLLINLFNCDYLAISMLDHESLDIVISSASFVSLDVSLVDRRNTIAWQGTGDFKQGGVFGIGRYKSSQIAKEIVDLAFAYWQHGYVEETAYRDDAERTPGNNPPPRQTYKPERTTDETILQVQQALTSSGYDPGPVDGFIGSKTRKAIRQYQKDTNIAVTGRPDSNTIIALGIEEGTVQYLTSDPVEADALPTAVNSVQVTSLTELKQTKDPFSKTIAMIPEDATVSIKVTDGEWYKVDYEGWTGYIHSSFVLGEKSDKSTCAPLKEKKQKKQENTSGIEVKKNNKQAQQTKKTVQAEPTPKKATIGKGKISEATVLLSEPSFMADRIQDVKAGQQLELLEKKEEFYKVRMKGKEGYIYADFLEVIRPVELNTEEHSGASSSTSTSMKPERKKDPGAGDQVEEPDVNEMEPATSNGGAASVVKDGGTIVRKVGETLEDLGTEREGSFIGGGLSLAGKIYTAVGGTIEEGAEEMEEGGEISFVEANKRVAVAGVGAVNEWAGDLNQNSQQIIQAQKVLSKLGYYTSPVDGVIGQETKKAIRNYQASEGLNVNGELDMPTLQSLGIT